MKEDKDITKIIERCYNKIDRTKVRRARDIDIEAEMQREFCSYCVGYDVTCTYYRVRT